MLQEIRERAQGWVAWAIVILISIPFAFWGIDSYFGGGVDPFVAKVNGTEITEREFNQNVQRTRIELRERLGAAYDPALFDNQRLREQVLERMVGDAVLLSASLDMGLRVSDQAVRAAVLAEPFFQDDGVFSNATYQRVLRQQGLSPAGFEQGLRQRLLATQLPRAISDSEFVIPAFVAESTRLLQQQREVAYVTLAAADFMPEQMPDEAAIRAYYDTNEDTFQTPEQVRLAFIVIDADALSAGPLADPQAFDEVALRERYQARIDEFTVPEQRRLRHILLAVSPDADADAVREQLLAVRARIDAGEPFASVAEAVSDDPGSAAQGGDLGLVPRGIMDPAFEQAAFALAPNQVSEPVRSRFGYHLIEVTGIEGGETQPFEAVRAQLLAEASAGRAEGIYFDLAERLATLSFESPDSLVPAAEELGLEVQLSDWIDRNGGDGLLGHPRVVAAAFSQDVLEAGNNSELIEPAPEALQAIVLRVDEHRPSARQPLEAVRDEIIEALRAQTASAAALAEAEALVARLEAGVMLDEAVGEREVKRLGLIGRTAATVPPAALTLAFALPRPGPGAASFGSTADANGNAMVVAVTGVEEAGPDESSDAAALASERAVLTDMFARAATAEVLADLENRARIVRRPLQAETDL